MTNSGSPVEHGGDDSSEAPSLDVTSMRDFGCRLTRLKVDRFRDLAPGTELRFDDGLNVLLGRNGTGKTTLLELICSVVRGDFSTYRGESFQLEFDILLGNLEFSVWVHNTAALELTARVAATGGSAYTWKYRVSLASPSGPLCYAEANPGLAQIERGGVKIKCDKIISPFDPGFYTLQLLSTTGLPADVSAEFFLGHFRRRLLEKRCLRLDEGLDVFRSLTEGKELPRIEAPMCIPVIELTSPNESLEYTAAELSTVYAPSSAYQQIIKRNDSIHDKTEISFRAEDQSFIERTVVALGAKDMQCTMKLLRREQGGGRGSSISIFGKPSFWITTHRGTTYTHDQLSYGEKRLLTFMYHAAANPEILVADELVNGLHHEWIQACLDAIQGQAFLTSQNPLLLDHLSFESPQEAERRFVLCDRDEDGNWTWQNMDPDAADSFYRAYEVGLQHVGEILRTSGLW